MTNPFRLRWLQGWVFQVVFMEGHVQVEAHGFGICLRTAVLPGESPQTAADRLVLAEDRRRRALGALGRATGTREEVAAAAAAATLGTSRRTQEYALIFRFWQEEKNKQGVLELAANEYPAGPTGADNIGTVACDPMVS